MYGLNFKGNFICSSFTSTSVGQLYTEVFVHTYNRVFFIHIFIYIWLIVELAPCPMIFKFSIKYLIKLYKRAWWCDVPSVTFFVLKFKTMSLKVWKQWVFCLLLTAANVFSLCNFYEWGRLVVWPVQAFLPIKMKSRKSLDQKKTNKESQQWNNKGKIRWIN